MLAKKMLAKIVILVKTRNFGQNSKFWSKLEILVKNQRPTTNYNKL